MKELNETKWLTHDLFRLDEEQQSYMHYKLFFVDLSQNMVIYSSRDLIFNNENHIILGLANHMIWVWVFKENSVSFSICSATMSEFFKEVWLGGHFLPPGTIGLTA